VSSLPLRQLGLMGLLQLGGDALRLCSQLAPPLDSKVPRLPCVLAPALSLADQLNEAVVGFGVERSHDRGKARCGLRNVVEGLLPASLYFRVNVEDQPDLSVCRPAVVGELFQRRPIRRKRNVGRNGAASGATCTAVTQAWRSVLPTDCWLPSPDIAAALPSRIRPVP
jgi:hypothetical protein